MNPFPTPNLIMKPIIVCGMDSTGKSTLIYQLADHYRALAHKCHLKRHTLRTIQDYHAHLLKSPFPAISDRHPAISDYIYGNVLRNYSVSSPHLISSMLPTSTLIYCRPPIHRILDTLNNQDQMDGVIPNAQLILEEYDRLMGSLSPIITYDYTLHSLQETIDAIDQHNRH